MRRIFTLAHKDLLLIWRDWFGMFWIVGFPLIFAVFFGAVIGGGDGGIRGAMNVAIIDEDDSEFSRSLTAHLASSEGLRVERLALEESADRVRRGRLSAYVLLRDGLGTSLGFGEDLVEIGMDPSRQAETGFLQGMLMAATFETLTAQFSDPAAFQPLLGDLRTDIADADDLTPLQRGLFDRFLGELDQFLTTLDAEQMETTDTQTALGGPGVTVVSVARDRTGEPRSSYEVMFPIALLWGMMGCSASFAITLVKERRIGTHLRLIVSPLSRAQILAGKGLACFSACLLVMILLLALGRLGFGVRLKRPVSLTLAILSVAVGFVGIMMLLATLGRTEEGVAGAGWATMIIMAMIGGAMIPRFVMPQWLKDIGVISPIKWGIEALEGAIWRDYTLAEMLPVCGVMAGIGLTCYAVGVMMMRRHET